MPGTEHLVSAPIYTVVVYSLLGACLFFAAFGWLLDRAIRRRW